MTGPKRHDVIKVSAAIFLLNFMSFWIACADSYEVLISQQNGVDNSSCLLLNESLPCKSIDYALQVLEDGDFNNYTTFRFSIQDRLYVLENQVRVLQPRPDRHIILTAADNTSVAIRCGTKNPSALIIGSYKGTTTAYNIRISHLEFQYCGYDFPSVVLMWDSRNITIDNCVFRNNTRAGINAFDSSVAIEDCLFMNNTLTGNLQKQAPGKSPSPRSLSAAGGAGFVFHHGVNLSMVIRNTEFISNAAVLNDSENFIPSNAVLPSLDQIGGGVLVVFIEEAQSCNVLIENTNFTNNVATFGGGLFSCTAGMATNNALEVRNSSFVNNIAGQAGGAVSLSLWDTTSYNSMVFKNCTISNNWSRRGGGLNVFLMNIPGMFTDSVLQFDNVFLSANRGLSSAAVRLDSALPLGNPIDVKPEFINCTITDHTASYLTYTSPFTSQRVNVRFRGWNVFKRNFGAGAVEHQGGVLYVHGKLEFIDNSGSQGGAVLLRSSQIILHPGSELSFIKNYASGSGGAIVVLTRTMYEFIHANNPDCFLTYSDTEAPPSKWKAKVSFIKNSAKIKGAAVYISSLASCLWCEKYPFYSPEEALRWNGTVEYIGNYIQPACGAKPLKGPGYDIATDTSHFRSGVTEPLSIQLSPGENTTLEIQGFDELNHKVYTIAMVTETNNLEPVNHLLLDNNMHILSPTTKQSFPFVYRVSNKTIYEEITKNSTTHHFLLEDIFSTLKNRYSFRITSIPCRPGFKFEDTKCVCDKSIVGVLRCGNARTVYLKEGYWGGVVDGNLVTYFCPSKYCRCHQKGDLPGCRFDPVHTDDQCAPNRSGVLCGRCMNNLSVGLRWENCVECHGGGWILGLVIFIVIALCVVIIILNPTMSSELRGPLFFFQILPFIFDPNNEVGKVVLFMSDMLNFGGPFIYFLHTCIVSGMNNLYAVAIGYLMPFVTLVVFLISYVMSNNFYLVKFKFRKNSSLHSFWLLTLFMYNYLVGTTFMLLHCPRVGNKLVFFYDGSVECFKGPHLVIALLAVFVLCTVIIPLPIVVLVLTKGYWKVDPQYVSTLTNGLRPHCLWWWSVDMWRRVLLMATYAFIADWYNKQVLMILMCVLVLAVHSSFQPYKKKRVNVTESLYLVVLCVLAIMQVLRQPDISDDVCSTLLMLVSIHAFVLTVYKAVRFFEERFKCSCPKQLFRRRHYASMGQTKLDDESLDEGQKTRRDIFDTIFHNSGEVAQFGNNN